jgi:putative membrane protein insertion efficiency factor
VRELLRLPGLALIGLIRLYQLSIARMLPQRCRFHPSCSEYAVQAIQANGLIKGGAAAGWRVLRCGPWSPGGVDHVKLRGVTQEVAGG